MTKTKTTPKKGGGHKVTAPKLKPDEIEVVAEGKVSEWDDPTKAVPASGEVAATEATALPLKEKKSKTKKTPRKSASSKATDAIFKKRKARRSRPGVAALRHIIRLQKSVENLVPKLPFQRLVREITADLVAGGLRFSMQSLLALQQASESFLIDRFMDSNKCAIHSKRVTVMQKDMRLAATLTTHVPNSELFAPKMN